MAGCDAVIHVEPFHVNPRAQLRIDVDAHIFVQGRAVMQHETNTAKIIARLEKEGWENVGGAKHTKFRKPGHLPIMVPRHRQVTPGVAQSIAKAAGWSK